MKEQIIEFKNKVLDFGEFVKYSKTFIESGSCHGRTIQTALDKGYLDIHSVEVWKPFYEICKERFKDNDVVNLYFGKSTDKFTDMLNNINKSIAVIFLDAHPTGPNTGGHDDLMEKGDKSEFQQDSILKAELEIILNHRKDHVIIIDDQNGLNEVSQAHINQVYNANPNYKFYFYNEGEDAHFYKNKLIVCIAE